jgi:hypothetical protein
LRFGQRNRFQAYFFLFQKFSNLLIPYIDVVRKKLRYICRSMLEKGIYLFSWSPPYIFCVQMEGFLAPCKIYLRSKLSCKGRAQRTFYIHTRCFSK